MAGGGAGGGAGGDGVGARLPRRVERLAKRAGGVLLFERLWRAFLPALCLLGVFLALAFLDVWAALPAFVHLVGLLGFAVGLGYLVRRGVRGFARPNRAEALARIEGDSRLAHRPLRGLDDDLPEAMDDPLTRSLWERHRARALAGLKGLRLGRPRSPWPRLDPWAARSVVVLLLAVGAVAAGGRAPGRLLDALTPRLAAAPIKAEAPLRADLWITPPVFTGLAPLALGAADARAGVAVPAGSEALLQVQGPGAPASRLRLGETAIELARLGESSAEARFRIERGGGLAVAGAAGESVRRWEVTILPDAPPTAAFSEPPGATARGALDLPYAASDDYGVAGLSLVLAAPEGGEEEVLPVAAPATQPTAFKGRAFSDLTRHPRAGLPTVLRLQAADARGQTGRSEPVQIVLPERRFTHPLAQAVIAERKRLVADPRAWRQVAGSLDALAETPLARAQPLSVPLTLGVAASRLREDKTGAARATVVDLLFDLALFIEDGGLSVAERALRDAQDRLEKALLEGADDAELEKLMQDLQEAMQAYLDEMGERMRQAMKNAKPEDMQPMPEGAQTVDRQQLQRLLDQAKEMMRAGARDAAQQMLSELRQMLENLRAGVPQQRAGPQQQALQDLQRMIQLQQGLMDKTFQQQQGQGQQGQQGRQGQQAGSAQEQEALRRALGELMRRLGEAGGEIPGALGQSELQMRAARDALKGGQPGEALGPQGQALDLMRQAGQALVESMQQQAGQAGRPGRQGQGGRAQRPGEGKDLFGRDLPGGFGVDGNDVNVPTQSELGQARRVLDEIRRRTGQSFRPRPELDYYDRLLDRF
ncbi:MAG: DUF4175 family protein [Geminicoccaceae bacterium]|nr:DUF4175 family protein [Geminicoccaceae bacterium]